MSIELPSSTDSLLDTETLGDMPSKHIAVCVNRTSGHTLHLIGYSVIFIIGLLLNAIALGIFICCLRLNTVVSIYMCNLAVSDLLFTLSLPFRLHYYFHREWPFGDPLCQLSGTLFQINMYGSCLFLLCINIDRFIAIVYPLRLRHLRRVSVAWLVCIIIWIIIIISSIPVVFIHKTTSCRSGNQTVQLCFERFSNSRWKGKILPMLVIAEVFGFLLPLAVVIYCSTRILLWFRRTMGLQTVRCRRTIRLLIANMLIFAICFVPYNTTLTVYGLSKGKLISLSQYAEANIRHILLWTMVMASSNCVLDPAVYYFSTEGFCNTFGKIWTKSRGKEAMTGACHNVKTLHSGNETQSQSGLALTFSSADKSITIALGNKQ
ncbi:lysophosphatidic acid receptor 5-like [Protopterus annectens]|uniref:lysophosphatidic acid receptor 5-like n=1 Tax=Protopterus annectens TaxID=7888 RepID=UPI001CFA53FE|nr:lysophosphatidic acid receptor 5-like [Protopterus annectens]